MNTKTLITRISELVEPTIKTMGYDLWGCELLNSAGRFILRIYIDSDAGIKLGDCQKVSHQIGALLDVEGVMTNTIFNLEVSSPGIDRCLFNEEQYQKFINSEVRIRLSTPMNGRRTYVGKIVEITAGNVGVITAEGSITIPFNQIEKTKIIPQF
jgi:ribosome maturation factor RimP